MVKNVEFAHLDNEQIQYVFERLNAVSMECFKIFDADDAEPITQYYEFAQNSLKLLKEVIRIFPKKWKYIRDKNMPGYIATYQKAQECIVRLTRLIDEIEAVYNSKFTSPQIEVSYMNYVYGIWTEHTWGFKCFVGAGIAPAAKLMSREEYDAKYSNITQKFYEKHSFKDNNINVKDNN